MFALRYLAGQLIAVMISVLRLTCRVRHHRDPRPALRESAQSYVYSVLHAHQVTAIMDGEPGTGAMVSRSSDGCLIIPSLRARGIVPVRGSSNRHGKDKGGSTAFVALTGHVLAGSPAYLAVDGPRGPRSEVQRGIALLSQRTGAVVLNIIGVPTRRLIFTRAWDRLQIPLPFSTIDIHYAEPIYPREGEATEHYRKRIENSLRALEAEHDPDESPHFQGLPEVAEAPIAALASLPA